MPLNEYKARFERTVHDFLWKQWSQLGVIGAAPSEERWIIDPESLLLFSLSAARTDPRLYDEVLDWLLVNGAAMDVQRLRNAVKREDESVNRLAGVVASLMTQKERSAKWTRLSQASLHEFQREPLFLLSDRPNNFPSPDPTFLEFGFLRSAFRPRGQTRSVPMHSPASLRFRLRAFFGIGIRAEAIAYLLSHEGGHAVEVAEAIGYSHPGVQQALREMASSDVIHVTRKGREKHYWLDNGRWLDFLTPNSREQARWVHWAKFFEAMSMLLRFTRRQDLGRMSDYVIASEMNQVIESAAKLLEQSEMAFHLPPREASVEEYVPQALTTIESLMA